MKKIYLACLLIVLSYSLSLAQTIAQTASTKDSVYVCPPCGSCDYTTYDHDGKCPACGMALIKMSMADFKKQISLKPVNVCFYIQDGVELLDFAGPMEVFTTAGFKVFTVSKTKTSLHTNGLSFVPNYSIKDAPPADVLVVFGGSFAATVADAQVMQWISSQRSSTSYFLSVCTGAFILGKAGILDNLTATTYFLQIDNLQKALPKTKVLPNTRFVDNGNVITTAGISAGIDGALHLVEKLRGRAYAKSIAQTIEYDKWVPEQGLVINKSN
jgi:transcriptional regulator GlxA family with amidase domain